jgi:signal transduction histidine kinase
MSRLAAPDAEPVTIVSRPALRQAVGLLRVKLSARLLAASFAIGRTAYRIAQEGLTNARKHAPGAAVTLAVHAPDRNLQVEVRSLAPVAVAAAAPPPGTGTGLIGLAERVSLAGGTLEHGIDPDGAFVLRANLPR